MVSYLKTVAHKGCKISVQFFFFFWEFCLTSRIFLLLVLLSASEERFFVSHMQDFFYRYHFNPLTISFWRKKSFIVTNGHHQNEKNDLKSTITRKTGRRKKTLENIVFHGTTAAFRKHHDL